MEATVGDKARAAGDVVAAVLGQEAYKAVKYISPKLTVKATRQLLRANGRRIDHRDKRVTLLVTIGTPNYEEEKFIKLAVKAGEPFPIKRIHMKFPPEKKGGKGRWQR